MSQRPLYYRLLRLQHIRPKGPVTFAFFEGSIGVAALLALAEIVSWWGLLAIPVTVALMVKLNDIVAGAGNESLTFGSLATPRLAGGVIIGRSPVPRPSRLTTAIGYDDARADPSARPDSAPTARGRTSGVARGVAAVPPAEQPARPRAPQPRPRPAARQSEPHFGPTTDGVEFGNATSRLDPGARRTRGNKGRFTN